VHPHFIHEHQPLGVDLCGNHHPPNDSQELVSLRGTSSPDLFNVPGNLAVRDRRVLRDVAGSLVAPCRPSGGWLEKGLRSGRVRRVGWLNRGLL
jgi:hypothetical protein